jgi:hypothetical protein
MVPKTEENKVIRTALGSAGIRTVSVKHKGPAVLVTVQKRLGSKILGYTHARWKQTAAFNWKVARIVSQYADNFRVTVTL